MTKANGDLQAVILVGPGDRLYPLVDEATVNVNVSASAICSSTGNINIINTTGTGGVCSSSGTIPSSTINSSTSMTGSSSNPNLNLNQANVNNFSSTSTSNYSKAMLPLCNRPLIYYPLTWLTQNGIGGKTNPNLFKNTEFINLFVMFCRGFHCGSSKVS